MKTLFILSVIAVSVANSLPAHPKVASDLGNVAASGAVDVIVQFIATPTERHHQKVKDKGGQLKADLSGTIKGAHYTLPARAVEDLANDPEVVYVSPNREVHGMLDYANPTIGANLAFVNGVDGKGVGIAMIDSGVITVADLRPAGLKSSSQSRVIYS